MKPAIKLFLTVFIFLTLGTSAYSQKRSSITGKKFRVSSNARKRKPLNYLNSIQLMGTINAVSYAGDLCDGIGCFSPRPSFAIGAQYRYNESLSFRGDVTYFRLFGSDIKDGTYAWRGLSFFSNNLDVSASVVYDILQYNKMYRRRALLSPYLTLGIGFMTVNPQARLEGVNYKLRGLQTEGKPYRGMAGVLPYGFGVRIKMTPSLNLGIESVWRLTTSDYIDDVSDTYSQEVLDLPDTDIRKQLADRRAEAGADAGQLKTAIRGNPKSNDVVWFIGFKFEYTIKVTKQRYNINSNTSRFRLIKSIKKK